MKYLFLIVALMISPALAHVDPYIDIRKSEAAPTRNADGTIRRDAKAVREFRRVWVCPATSSYTGACDGWQVDHVIPLSCGGVDAVWNMQWLPIDIKVYGKDRFERTIYGGSNISKGCK